jgi:hypothetical protein
VSAGGMHCCASSAGDVLLYVGGPEVQQGGGTRLRVHVPHINSCHPGHVLSRAFSPPLFMFYANPHRFLRYHSTANNATSAPIA